MYEVIVQFSDGCCLYNGSNGVYQNRRTKNTFGYQMFDTLDYKMKG